MYEGFASYDSIVLCCRKYDATMGEKREQRGWQVKKIIS